MTTSFRARFEDGKLVPQEPVDLPANQELEVEVRPSEGNGSDARTPVENAKPALLELLEEAEKYPQDPASHRDGAAQHDHYLYDLPKRENP